AVAGGAGEGAGGTRAWGRGAAGGLWRGGRVGGGGPPLLPRAPSRRLAPKGRLLPLVPDGVYPVPLPMALKFTLTVPALKMSGPMALLFPETMVLAMVMVPVPLTRPMPPPPCPEAVLLAVLPVMVLSWTSTV